MNQPLRIENPCPFRPTALTATNGGHYCKGCKNKVLDLRDKPKHDLIEAKANNQCMIVYADQLDEPVHLKRNYRFIFKLMTWLSFLGFAVSPLNSKAFTPFANQSDALSDHSVDPQSQNGDEETKDKKKKKKGKRVPKHVRKTMTGF
jgi:hypothetical protein